MVCEIKDKIVSNKYCRIERFQGQCTSAYVCNIYELFVDETRSELSNVRSSHCTFPSWEFLSGYCK